MATSPNQLPPDVLRIWIDTDGTVPGELLLDWAMSVLTDLRSFEGVGPETVFKIRHLGQGSPTIFEVVCNGLIAVGTIGLFATSLASYLKAGEGKAAPITINIVNSYNATNVTFDCAELAEPLTVRREEMSSLAPVKSRGGFGLGGDATLTDGAPKQTSRGEAAAPPSSGNATHEPEVRMIHDDASPLAQEERFVRGSSQPFTGTLQRGHDGLEFVQTNGLHALVDGFAVGLSVPNDVPIEIDATLRRGSRGGLADPRLIIWNWRPIDDPEAQPAQGDAPRFEDEDYDEDADIRAYEEAGFEPIVEDDPPDILDPDGRTKPLVWNYIHPNGPIDARIVEGRFELTDDGGLIFSTGIDSYPVRIRPDLLEVVPLNVNLNVSLKFSEDGVARVFGWKDQS